MQWIAVAFGLQLNWRLQSQGAPLLGPQHRQVGQALDAKPARRFRSGTMPLPRLLAFQAHLGLEALEVAEY